MIYETKTTVIELRDETGRITGYQFVREEAQGPQDYVLDLARIRKNYEARAAAVDAEIKRLRDKKASADNAVDRVIAEMRAVCRQHSIAKAKDGAFSISYREKDALEVVDEAKIPEAFWKQVPTLDKAALREAWETTAINPETGEETHTEIPGVQTVTRGIVTVR